MSITTTDRKAGPFQGDDVTTEFPFDFVVYDKSHLKVILTSGFDKELVLDADYSVSLNEDQETNPGGFITLSSPLAEGEALTILTDQPSTQTAVLNNMGGFFPKTIEKQLDWLTILIQQIEEELGRAVKVGVTDEPISPNALRALQDLVNGDGVSIGGDLSVNGNADISGTLTVDTGSGTPRVGIQRGGTLYTFNIDGGGALRIVRQSGEGANTVRVDAGFRSGSLTVDGAASIGGTISGDGSGLTNLNASNLSSGTVPSARLPATVAERQLDTITVDIPDDYATLQEALDAYSGRTFKQGVQIILRIKSGHSPASGIKVKNGDFSHFIIQSEDATVTLDSSFPSDDTDGYFIYGENAVLPVLDCLVDMNGRGRAGVYAIHRCSFRAESGAGCINSGGDGCRIRRASIASVSNTVWSGAALNGILANEASIVDARNAVCDDCGERGFWANNSFMAARDASAKRCGLRGVQCDPGGIFNGNVDVSGSFVGLCCQGGLASFGASNASNCTDMALLVFEGGHVRAHNLVATGSGSPTAACVVSQASSAFLRGSDFSGAAGDGLRVLSGSTVDARNVNCSGVGGTGVVVEEGGRVEFSGGTGTLSQPPNMLLGAGIITYGNGGAITTVNSSRALQLSDVGRIIRNTTGSVTYTLPSGFPIGSRVELWKYGSGTLTIKPDIGVTLTVADSTIQLTGAGGGSVSLTRLSIVTVTYYADNVWVLNGPPPGGTLTINEDAS